MGRERGILVMMTDKNWGTWWEKNGWHQVKTSCVSSTKWPTRWGACVPSHLHSVQTAAPCCSALTLTCVSKAALPWVHSPGTFKTVMSSSRFFSTCIWQVMLSLLHKIWATFGLKCTFQLVFERLKWLFLFSSPGRSLQSFNFSLKIQNKISNNPPLLIISLYIWP